MSITIMDRLKRIIFHNKENYSASQMPDPALVEPRLSAEKVIAEKYPLPNSPFKAELAGFLESVYRQIMIEGEGKGPDSGHVLSNGLYLVGKYMMECEYQEGNDREYLTCLLEGIGIAQRRYQETCYSNTSTETIIRDAKYRVISLLDEFL